MQFKLMTAVLAAAVAIVAAQSTTEEYQLNPKFPDYVKLNNKPSTPETPTVPTVPAYEKPEVPEYEKPEVPEYKKPEIPKFEKPVIPEYKKPEIPEYEVPELPKIEKPDVPEYEKPEFPKFELPTYERPETPEYNEPEEHEYQVPTYPSEPEYPEFVYTHPSPYYYGRPDFTATHPPQMEKKEEDDTESTMKEETKTGNDTSADSEMDEESSEKMEEEEEKKDYTQGVPVFNFHEYQVPKLGEHNFDDFIFNLTFRNPKDENSTDDEYLKVQESREVPVAKYQSPVFNYYPTQYPVPGTYAPGAKVEYNPVPGTYAPGATVEYNPVPGTYAPGAKVEYNPVPEPGYTPVSYPHPGKPNFNVPQPAQYQRNPVYHPTTGAHQYQNVVEKEGSYYRLDTCEYRFILDMVQCHEVERHTENVKVHSQGQGNYHQGQGPYYNYNYNPAGHHVNPNGFPYQAPYDSRYTDFQRLYGNPMYYVNPHSAQSYKPGHFDDSLFSFSPSVGHPFYAPGLHNTPFAKYYAGFRAGKFEQGHEAETRQYHKEGHYQSALQDFNNLKLQKVVKVDSESESSIKTSSKLSVSNEAGYEGYTPAFDYKVRLIPNHCSVPGYNGRHTCIVFSGATHPYRMVHRQFIYLTNTREVQGRYRQRYEDSQRVQYH